MRLLGCALFLIAVRLSAANLAGVWEFTVSMPEQTEARRVRMELKDGKYTGKFLGLNLTATLKGDAIEIQCMGEKEPCGSLTGKFTSSGMEGDGKLFDLPATWSARRPVTRPANAPRFHEFVPKEYRRQFSGSTPPVLHIFPGDTVHTKGVDAGGRDEKGVRYSSGGNPLTGPFYVEGAMPGDTLVVKLNRVRLNRDTAESGEAVVGSALDPYYFKDQKRVEKFDGSWKLDREKGFATLKNPTDRLKNYTVKLQPMLGCVGVAPPGRQAFPFR